MFLYVRNKITVWCNGYVDLPVEWPLWSQCLPDEIHFSLNLDRPAIRGGLNYVWWDMSVSLVLGREKQEDCSQGKGGEGKVREREWKYKNVFLTSYMCVCAHMCRGLNTWCFLSLFILFPQCIISHWTWTWLAARKLQRPFCFHLPFFHQALGLQA